MTIYLRQLNELWGEAVYSLKPNFSSPIGPVCTDSREVVEGSFFVPLIGERFNGHNFLLNAFEAGAKAAVVSTKFSTKVPKGCLHWLVEDTLEAYQQLALLHRDNLGSPVIAVTGSTGKTTTRELIRGVLHPLGSIASSFGNNNNDVGVPFTLLQSNKKDAAIVVEMGMRGLGEIKRLSRCAQPDIAVITNIGTAHIGRLGSRENIAMAKCEITYSLKPNGLVVIPANDPLLEETLSNCWKGRVIRVSLTETQLSGDDPVTQKETPRDFSVGLLGVLNLQKGFVNVNGQKFLLPFEGKHNAMNFMLALAVAKELGVSFEDLKDINVKVPWGRSQRFTLGGITFLDETYNSSPESVRASIELLVSKSGRHFAVLGSMHELGKYSIPLHEKIAELAVDVKLDGLVIVAQGEEAEAMAVIAKQLSRMAVVSTPQEALKYLYLWLRPGDIVLIKASRAVKLEKIIPSLTKYFSQT